MVVLRMLLTLRRFLIAAGIVAIVVVVWLGARRAGRRGLEAAIPLWALAVVCFGLAVFSRFPSVVDIALVLLSAVLLVVSVVALVLLGLAPSRKRRVELAKHNGPPWDDDKW